MPKIARDKGTNINQNQSLFWTLILVNINIWNLFRIANWSMHNLSFHDCENVQHFLFISLLIKKNKKKLASLIPIFNTFKLYIYRIMTHSSTYTLLDDDIFSERHLLNNILLTRLDMVLPSSTYVQRRISYVLNILLMLFKVSLTCCSSALRRKSLRKPVNPKSVLEDRNATP